MEQKKRLQFDVPLSRINRMNELKQQHDIGSDNAFFRKAMDCYDTFADLDETCILEVQDAAGRMLYRIPVQLLH